MEAALAHLRRKEQREKGHGCQLQPTTLSSTPISSEYWNKESNNVKDNQLMDITIVDIVKVGYDVLLVKVTKLIKTYIEVRDSRTNGVAGYGTSDEAKARYRDVIKIQDANAETTGKHM
ncbi:hypothetical protein L1987_64965 [Smallanthus sonchifolius]|uniref:Uncharacterized protein n=1 Tax=Smallanthus sonchifolius TaxID=185202 RepID=A0ACB9BT72_9ASTR|nr:hypothetical protein L1987_64965 [Smallanthus sonchifolius]